MPKDQIHFTPEAGSTIYEAAVKAVGIAHKESSDVMMNFNDAVVIVKPDHLPHEVVDAYRAKRSEISEAFRRSEAGAAADEKAKAVAVAVRKKVSELVDILPTVLERGLPETINWVRDYARTADHSAADPQADKVLDAFLRAGYEPNAHVGASFPANDPKVFGKYIIGQVMACLISEGKPHPVAASFCDSYLKQVESLNSPDERNFRRASVKMAPKPGQP